MIHYLHHDLKYNRIFVKSGDSAQDNRFRFLPGSRWLPSRRVWSLVATPVNAWVVLDACGQDPTEKTGTYLKLLAEGDNVAEAEAVREALELPPIPITKYTPWLHQLQAYHFATKLPGVMLAMDMGTGKTKVTYDIIQNDPAIERVLIGAPKAVVSDAWAEQFEEHWAANDGTGILALDEGTIVERANRAYDYLTSNDAGRRIIAINYEVLLSEIFKEMVLSCNWDLVVLDESHRIRSAGGVTSRFMFRLGERTSKRMCLSGTPLANGPRDVYGQYRFLDAGVFGTNITRFDDEFVLKGGFGGHQVLGYHNLEEFNRRFFSIAFRVDEDVLDLPPKHDVLRKTKMTSKTRKLYTEMDKEFITWVQGHPIAADNTLVRMTRLQQMTSGYTRNAEKKLLRIGHEKSDLLEDVLAGLDVHEPLVIFAQYHPELDEIKRVCTKAGRSVGELSGRANDRLSWKRGEIDVLAVQIDAGSLGVGFTRARYAIFYSLGHDLEVYRQARKRVHRPKQTRPVTFIHLLVRNSIDIDIMRALRKKQSVIEYIYNLKRAA